MGETPSQFFVISFAGFGRYRRTAAFENICSVRRKAPNPTWYWKIKKTLHKYLQIHGYSVKITVSEFS